MSNIEHDAECEETDGQSKNAGRIQGATAQRAQDLPNERADRQRDEYLRHKHFAICDMIVHARHPEPAAPINLPQDR